MPKPRAKPTPKRSTAKPSAPARPRRLWLNLAALVVTVGTLGALAVLSGAPTDPKPAPVAPHPVASTPPPSRIVRRADALTPKTLAELLALPPEQLERVDIGLMSLHLR